MYKIIILIILLTSNLYCVQITSVLSNQDKLDITMFIDNKPKKYKEVSHKIYFSKKRILINKIIHILLLKFIYKKPPLKYKIEIEHIPIKQVRFLFKFNIICYVNDIYFQHISYLSYIKREINRIHFFKTINLRICA